MVEWGTIKPIEDRDFKFKLSKDSLYKKDNETKYTKKFIGFKHLNQLESYIETNGKTYNHYYQIIDTNICKLYFDIDKCDLTEIELNNVIDRLIGIIKVNCNVDLLYSDFIIEHTEKINDKYNSIHLIICKYKTEKSVMKDLVLDYNRQYDSGSEFLDSKVYTTNRQFKLCDMIKLKDKENNKLHKKQSSHFNSKHFSFSDRYISYCNSCNEIKWTNENTKSNIIEYKIQKYTDKPKVGNVIYVNDIDSLVVYDWLNDLSEEFFNNDMVWGMTTYNINKFLECDCNVKKEVMNDWFNKSYSKYNKEHKYETNKDWFDNKERKKYWEKLTQTHSIHSLLKMINKFNHKQYDLDNNSSFNEDIINFINKKTKLTKEDIISQYENVDTLEQKIYFSKTEYWDLKQLILIWDNKLFNYNEKLYSQEIEQSTKIDIDNCIEYDNINTLEIDLQKEVKDFVNGNVDIIFLEAKWGTGKTHYFITPLIQSVVDINMNVRILIITENNNLNSEFKLKYDKYNFVSHTDTKNLCDYDRVICSVESLYKLKNVDFDYIILDEAESLYYQYDSEETIMKCNKSVYEAFNCLRMKFNNDCKIILADADLSTHRIELTKNIMVELKKEMVYRYIKITINRFSNTTIKHHKDYETFNKEIYSNVLENKNIVISSGSKNELDCQYKILQKYNETLNNRIILKMDSSGGYIDMREKCGDKFVSVKFLVNGVELTPIELKKYITKTIGLEEFILHNKITDWLYTPTITTGISFNTRYFHKHFSYGRSGSIKTDQHIQMLFRNRQNIDNEIHLYIIGSCRYRPPITIDKLTEIYMNISYNNNQKNYKNGIFNVSEEERTTLDIDSNYCRMKLINKYDNYNSLYRYKMEMVMKLKYKHKLKYEYVIDKPLEVEYIDYMKIVKTELEEERLNRLINTDLTNENGFNRTKQILEQNQQKDNSDKTIITEKEFNEFMKYQLLFGGLITDSYGYTFTKLNNLYKTDRELCDRHKEYYENYKDMIDEIDTEDYDCSNDLIECSVCKNYNEMDKMKCNFDCNNLLIGWECIDCNDCNVDNKSTLKQTEYNFWKMYLDCGLYEPINYETISDSKIVLDRDNYNEDIKVNVKKYMEIYNKIDRDINNNKNEIQTDILQSISIGSDNVEEITNCIYKVNGCYEFYDTEYNIQLIIMYMKDYKQLELDYNENVIKYYNPINNSVFYKLYSNRNTKKKYKQMNKVLGITNNSEIKTDKEIKNDEQNIKFNLGNVCNKQKENVDTGYCIELLKILDIDITEPKTFTNREFSELVMDTEIMNRLKLLDSVYVKQYKPTDNKIFIFEYIDKMKQSKTDKEHREYRSKIIQYVNKWLDNVNIKIKYKNKNNMGDNDRLEFKMKIDFKTIETIDQILIDNYNNNNLDCEDEPIIVNKKRYRMNDISKHIESIVDNKLFVKKQKVMNKNKIKDSDNFIYSDIYIKDIDMCDTYFKDIKSTKTDKTYLDKKHKITNEKYKAFEYVSWVYSGGKYIKSTKIMWRKYTFKPSKKLSKLRNRVVKVETNKNVYVYHNDINKLLEQKDNDFDYQNEYDNYKQIKINNDTIDSWGYYEIDTNMKNQLTKDIEQSFCINQSPLIIVDCELDNIMTDWTK